MAMALSLAVTAGAATLSDYSDSDKVTAKYATAVDFATQTGILEGMGNGTYAPQGTLTRAQLATMVYRMTTADVTDVYTANFAGGAAEAFSDTAATAWYAGYVGYAADAELLKGLGDGTYAPNSALTGYAALAAFLRGVGYDEPGHNFVGADWTIEVAKVAKQAGALEGITNVDLNKPITREVAAQMIYNIMFAKNVEYTPAFGYQAFWAGNTLAKDEFDIVSDKDGDAANVAPWGRPATIWVAKDGSDVTAAVTIEATPVATYTTAVNQCDLSKVVGENKTWEATRWENGYNNGTTSIDAKATKSDVAGTAQGTLTEVYEVEEDVYEIVEIQTWLAMVADVDKATYDKNGHEKTAADTDFTVYDTSGDLTWDAETEEFAEESYVLLNNSWFDGGAVTVEDTNITYTPDLEEGIDYGVLNITTATPVATGKLTDYDRTTAESTVAGTTYDWAVKYVKDIKPGTIGEKYDVYVDFYGNLIGLMVPETETNYTILDSGILVTNSFDPYYAGRIVNLSTGDLETVTVDKFDNRGSDALTWADDVVAELSCIVSYTSDEDGYDLTCAADDWSMGGKIVKGEPRVVGSFTNKVVADANTIYAVEDADGDYTIYTGYANVPSIETVGKIEVLDDDNDGFVDLVYVDVSSAVFAADETYAYVMEKVALVGSGELADGTAYNTYENVVINGEVVKKVKVAPSFDLTTVHGKGVELQIDANGLVTGVKELTYEAGQWTAIDYSGDVVHFAESDEGYVVDANTIIWIIDNNGVEAVAGSIADLTENAKCKIILDSDDVTLEKVIIFDTID